MKDDIKVKDAPINWTKIGIMQFSLDFFCDQLDI